jgi:hypothetical protein
MADLGRQVNLKEGTMKPRMKRVSGRLVLAVLTILVGSSSASTQARAGFFGDLGIGLRGGVAKLGSGVPGRDGATQVEGRLLYEPGGSYRWALVGRFSGNSGQENVTVLGAKIEFLRDLVRQGTLRPYAGLAAGYSSWEYSNQEYSTIPLGMRSQDRDVIKNLPELEALLGSRLFLGNHFCFDVSGNLAKPSKGYEAVLTGGIAVLF